MDEDARTYGNAVKVCRDCSMPVGTEHLRGCSRTGVVHLDGPLVDRHFAHDWRARVRPMPDEALGGVGPLSSPSQRKSPPPAAHALVAVIAALEPYHPDLRARIVAAAHAFLQDA